jgi:hypothetical protein
MRRVYEGVRNMQEEKGQGKKRRRTFVWGGRVVADRLFRETWAVAKTTPVGGHPERARSPRTGPALVGSVELGRMSLAPVPRKRNPAPGMDLGAGFRSGVD